MSVHLTPCCYSSSVGSFFPVALFHLSFSRFESWTVTFFLFFFEWIGCNGEIFMVGRSVSFVCWWFSFVFQINMISNVILFHEWLTLLFSFFFFLIPEHASNLKWKWKKRKWAAMYLTAGISLQLYFQWVLEGKRFDVCGHIQIAASALCKLFLFPPLLLTKLQLETAIIWLLTGKECLKRKMTAYERLHDHYVPNRTVRLHCTVGRSLCQFYVTRFSYSWICFFHLNSHC